MPRKPSLPADDPRAAGVSHQVSLSRRWLAGLAVLVVVPWLIAAALFLPGRKAGERGSGPVHAGDEPPAPAVAGGAGPWGQIVTRSIVISPPLEYIPEDVPAPERIEWYFPGASRDEVARLLEAVGVPPGDAERIQATLRDEPRLRGVVAAAPRELILGLDAEVRARLYLLLAAHPLNDRHRNAPRFRGDSVDEWLGQARIAPETLALVRPLVYRNEGFLLFADIDLVQPRIGDHTELRRLYKALLRESTLLLELRIPPGANADQLAAYWGIGGRRTDVRPLLESVAASGGSIDVVHLLPIFAREWLYRYPRVTLADLEKPALANCFWTALNFFEAKADDRFLQLDAALATLKRDYYIVHDGFQIGDLVFLTAEDGSFYHAAAYVADGILFGKNGNSPLAPWMFVRLEHVKGYYPEHPGGRPVFYRRKGL